MKNSRKIGSGKIAGVAISLAIGATSVVSVPAQAITECPDGWTVDYFSYPTACDFYIQGDDTFTVPAGVTSIAVLAVGGGGAGGAGGSVGGVEKAGGGGGGAEISQELLTVTPEQVLTVDIGAGGAQATLNMVSGAAGDGGDGATTTVKDAEDVVLVSAVGGKGGESGTNGGDGGPSGNSDPSLINLGGASFNGSGASSGGGGGGQWSPGNNGSLNVGGSAGLAEALAGENGMPSEIPFSMGFPRDTVLYPDYYPSTVWIYGSGLGGGGGTYQNDDDGCEDAQLGKSSVPDPDILEGQVGFGSCKSTLGYNAVANLSYSGAYPGQGGNGGVGVDTDDGNFDDSDHGTSGVDGIVWFRIFLEDAPPSEATYLDGDTDSLENGGQITFTTDADPEEGYWMGLWVDGEFVGPFPELGATTVWAWEDFSEFATCETREMSAGLFDPSFDPMSEISLVDAIDSAGFTYGPDPECGGGDSSGGNLARTGVDKDGLLGLAGAAVMALAGGAALFSTRRRRI